MIPINDVSSNEVRRAVQSGSSPMVSATMARDGAGYGDPPEVRMQIALQLTAMKEAATNQSILNILSDIFTLMQIGVTRMALSNAAAGKIKRGDSCSISVEFNTTKLIIETKRRIPDEAIAEARAYAHLAVAQIEVLKTRRANVSAIPSRQDQEEETNYDQWCAGEVARLARSPYNLMITGERGTGKTRIARIIHEHSPRAISQFVSFNCAALPEHLAEAELFGYKKGAFTGANTDHAGLFEVAHNSTIFLDEIGDLSLPLQAKILKAVEEKKIRRIGETRERSVNVRIISATARDLEEMTERGEFRADLYDRVTTLKFETAPLYERQDEIPHLISLFLREAERDAATSHVVSPRFGIEAKAVELLCRSKWTGNIRQLKNTILDLTTYLDGKEEEITTAQVTEYFRTRQQRPVDKLTEAIPNGTRKLDCSAATRLTSTAEPTENRLTTAGVVLPPELQTMPVGGFDQWINAITLHTISVLKEATPHRDTWTHVSKQMGVSRESVRSRYKRLHKEASDQATTEENWLPYAS